MYTNFLMASACGMTDRFKCAVMCVLLLHFPTVLAQYPTHILNITMLGTRYPKERLLSWSRSIKAWFVKYNGMYMEVTDDLLNGDVVENRSVSTACFHEFIQKSIAV